MDKSLVENQVSGRKDQVIASISFEPSTPYTQHQNGVSERIIRMIVDMKEKFWAEATNTAVYKRNRCLSSAVFKTNSTKPVTTY